MKQALKLGFYIKSRIGLNISVSQVYNDFLKEKKIVQLSHLPYSQDLSPCDLFLFPLLKKTLFSLPGRSPGRAIVLPPALTSTSASALAKC